MKVTATALPEVLLIEPDVFHDERGFFFESYSYKKYQQYGINDVFVQDNHSYSQKAGTLRGLHFQLEPYAQSKLVCCTRGRILDVAVDIRRNSPTYCKWVSVELSSKNFMQIYVPAGFAHGFITLAEDTEVHYKTSSHYAKDADRGIRWDDSAFNIDWGTDSPILSDKDKNAPFLNESDANFTWRNP